MSLYAPNPLPFGTGLAGGPGAGLTALDGRARDIFRRIVETYLETGEPVGLADHFAAAACQLSPASIRNTMQDLTLAGLLAAPHTSAGRIPTHAGLRLFVDGFLEIGDIGQDERREIDARLAGKGAASRRRWMRRLPCCRVWRAGRGSSPAPSVTPASNTSSSSHSATIRRWRCWSVTTARSRTG